MEQLSTTMECPDLFSLDSKRYLTTLALESVISRQYITEKQYEKALYLERQLFYGDYSGLEFPLEFQTRRESGKKRRDFLDNLGFIYMISDKLKQLLEENEVTGWKTYPITAHDRKGNVIEGYHGFSITGRVKGMIKYRTDNIDYSSNNKYPDYKGAYIDMDLWDGSDIFSNLRQRCVVVTRKVYDILKKNKIEVNLTAFKDKTFSVEQYHESLEREKKWLAEGNHY